MGHTTTPKNQHRLFDRENPTSKARRLNSELRAVSSQAPVRADRGLSRYPYRQTMSLR